MYSEGNYCIFKDVMIEHPKEKPDLTKDKRFRMTKVEQETMM